MVARRRSAFQEATGHFVLGGRSAWAMAEGTSSGSSGSRQRNQHDTIVVARFGDGRYRERQPGLAHTTWAYQSQQAIVRSLEKGGERRDLTFGVQ